MIVTVTANPSIDLTMAVPRRPSGDVQRARWVLVEPSGKGVNVAVALHRTGRDVLAVLPLGRGPGAELAPMLDALELRYAGVDVAGHVRTNVTLVEDDGTTSKVNEVGAALTADEVTALVEASLEHSRAGEWLAWCGSLPAGFDGERLADAVAAARAGGRMVAVDTSQAALPIVLARPPEQLPHLIKPNVEELAELTGRGFATIGDVVHAASELVARGVQTVLVSLGADGAILVDDAGTVRHGTAAAERVANTAGAGDALLAGYLWAATGPNAAGPNPAGAHGAGPNGGGPNAAGANGAGPDERLAWALRFGAAAVAQAGTLFAPPATFTTATASTTASTTATPSAVPTVHVGAVDRDRPLSEPVTTPPSAPQEENP